jgi:ADP-heptose:LPS heptosyltransferase
MNLKDINKILFITLSNIGDVILTLPVLSALKDNFPSAVIDVVVGPKPEEVFRKDPRVNRIFIYNKYADLKEKLEFIKKLRAEKYDLAIDMKTSIMPMLILAKNRSGIFLKNKRDAEHKRIKHLSCLIPFGIAYREQKNIYIDKDSKGAVDRILADNGVQDSDILIGISHGSKSRLKQWTKEGFIDVIKNIMKDQRYKIVLIGDIKETDISKEITRAVKQSGVIDLTGKTSLGELFALINRFKLLLTCDSASMHIASDLGVRVVALFGPTDPKEYGPRGSKDIILRKNLKCSPCKKAQCKLETHECMKSISASEVFEAIKNLIEDKT